MKALVYGDLQATEGRERLFSSPEINLQQHRVSLFYVKLEKLFKHVGCDLLWDLGDTTDDRTAIPIPTINALLDGIGRFKFNEHNFKLIGNHEQYIRSTRVHAGRLFNGTFSVFSQPEVKVIGGTTVVLAPYPDDHGALEKWLSEVKLTTPKSILLGHFQVAGSVVAGKSLIDGVGKDALKRFNLTLLGHVHRHQRLIEGVECYYLGSPFQLDFGEANDEKLVGVVDTDKCTVHFYKMFGFPRYSTVSVGEFVENSTDSSEDRFKVVAKSKEELDLFYSHPHSSRHVVVAEFQDSSAIKEEVVENLGIDQTVRKYFQTVPHDIGGFSEDDLVQAALDVVRSG